MRISMSTEPLSRDMLPQLGVMTKRFPLCASAPQASAASGRETKEKHISRPGLVGPRAAESAERKNMSKQLTSQIINAAIEVHRQIGPGLLESVYLRCLQIELEEKNIKVKTELQLPVAYKGKIIHDLGFRLDMLVEDQVVVELKSVQRIEPVHKKQLLSYLRLSRKEIGLLINFNEALLKDGIVRVINTLATP